MSVWLEGENPTILNRLLIYGGGLIGGIIILVLAIYDTSVVLPVWSYTLLTILSFDIIGGVVSNFTISTTEFYKKQSLLMKFIFLGLHFIHPLLFIFIFRLNWWFIITFPIMLVISTTILFVPEKSRKSTAALLVTFAMIIEFVFLDIPTILLWFIPAYLLKLSLSFATKW